MLGVVSAGGPDLMQVAFLVASGPSSGCLAALEPPVL